MKVLFIVSASIAITKCNEVFKKLKLNQIQIDCIVTDSAKKMINLKDLQKIVTGKIFTNRSENNKKMLHIELTRKSDLIVVCPATANIIAKFSKHFINSIKQTNYIYSCNEC